VIGSLQCQVCKRDVPYQTKTGPPPTCSWCGAPILAIVLPGVDELPARSSVEYEYTTETGKVRYRGRWLDSGRASNWSPVFDLATAPSTFSWDALTWPEEP
jgi:hypothetical protein